MTLLGRFVATGHTCLVTRITLLVLVANCDPSRCQLENPARNLFLNAGAVLQSRTYPVCHFMPIFVL